MLEENKRRKMIEYKNRRKRSNSLSTGIFRDNY
jgi:hypothetical protein